METIIISKRNIVRKQADKTRNVTKEKTFFFSIKKCNVFIRDFRGPTQTTVSDHFVFIFPIGLVAGTEKRFFFSICSAYTDNKNANLCIHLKFYLHF